VEKPWLLGNLHVDSWTEIARRSRRHEFAGKKAVLHEDCRACEYAWICKGGCPKHRRDPRGRVEDLDYFCHAYRQIYAKTLEPLRTDVEKILARQNAVPRQYQH
jgi:uncharacterized protein